MSFLLKIDHKLHCANFESLTNFCGFHINLIGSNFADGIAVHQLILGGASSFLKCVMLEIPISTLDTIIFPDFTNETLNLLAMLLCNRAIQCTVEQYHDICELMQLLCIDCSNIVLIDDEGNSIDINEQSEIDAEYMDSCDGIYDADEHQKGEMVCSSDFPKEPQQSCKGADNSESNNMNDRGKQLPGSVNDSKIVTLRGRQSEVSMKDVVNKEMIKKEEMIMEDANFETGVSSDSLEVLFSCTECDKSFSSAEFLQTHMLNHNKQVSTYRCSRCEFEASNARDMGRHQRLVHSELLVHECNLCSKLFSTRNVLVIHVRRVHSAKKFKCDMCDYACSIPNDLTKHVNRVHLQLKPHCCSVCGKCFAQSYLAEKHCRTQR